MLFHLRPDALDARRAAARDATLARLGSYRTAYGKLSQGQVDGLNSLLAALEDAAAVTDLRAAAYMLATVKHECADTWPPVVERGPRSYFNQYDAGTALGKRLGNTQPGDGYRFRGRGYVQITGRTNYDRLGSALGMDHPLMQNPELTLDPAVAYRIMSHGMRKGGFTGKKLSDYISETGCDYFNARRIINGLDQAARIQSCAGALEGVLRASVQT
ncbi:hypothetical protein [Zoogloea sp.]|uniref:hypothetical protein n=1 Tax=Zoogloea sp. TaxID=49181 RepID=UPI0035B4F9B9